MLVSVLYCLSVKAKNVRFWRPLKKKEVVTDDGCSALLTNSFLNCFNKRTINLKSFKSLIELMDLTCSTAADVGSIAQLLAQCG